MSLGLTSGPSPDRLPRSPPTSDPASPTMSDKDDGKDGHEPAPFVAVGSRGVAGIALEEDGLAQSHVRDLGGVDALVGGVDEREGLLDP